MNRDELPIGFLVMDLGRLMKRVFMREAKVLGYSQLQLHALARLSRRQGVKQVTLADTLEVQPISLARALDRLEKDGLVTRRRDPSDRRAFRLHLTAKAEPLLDQMWAIGREMRPEVFASLSEERVAVMTDALETLKRNLTAMDKAYGDPSQGDDEASG